MPGQVGQSPPAADQRVSGPLGDHRGQRRRQPPAEPHQHGRPPRQRPGPGQRGDRLAAQIQRGGQLAGHQVSLHGGGRSPRRGQPPRRTTGRGQVVRGQIADRQPRLGGDQQAAGPPGATGLLPVGVGRRFRRGQRLVGIPGQQGQLGDTELGVGGHHRGARRGQLLDRLAGRVGRLGQQPQFHQPVGVIDVVLAQRQPGGLVLADGVVEVGQPLDEPAGLNRDPGPRVDHVRDQMRPDLPGQRQGLVQAAQRGGVPALLALDHGQIVRHLDLAPEAEPGAGQQPLVDRHRLVQVTGVLQQDGPVEVQLRVAAGRHQRGRGAQVPVRGGDPAQFLAHRGVRDQDLGQHLVVSVPPGDPGRLVQQPDRVGLPQPGPLRPGLRAQGQGQGFRVAGPPGLGHQKLSFTPVALRVGGDLIVGLLRAYQEIPRLL